MKYLLLSVILILSCNSRLIQATKSIDVYNLKSSKDLQKLINEGYEIININKSKIDIDESIFLKSNVIINGNNTTQFFYKIKPYKNRFVVNNSKDITFKNFTVTPSKLNHEEDYNQGYYSFNIQNSLNVNFYNIQFKNNINTCISIYDVEDVIIDKCSFIDIGESTKNKNYSYEGIFIGAYGKGTDDVTISNCVFRNIGNEEGNSFINDGDGIQTYSKNSTIKNISIINCSFNNISRRGVKIQTGENIFIKDNVFNGLKMAFAFAMENSVVNVSVENNEFRNCNKVFTTDSYPQNICTLEGLVFKNNKIKNISGGIRTSGPTSIFNSVIESNIFENSKNYIISGRLSGCEIKNNKFINFQYEPHPKLKIRGGIILWNTSENNRIVNNVFDYKNTKTTDIFLYEITKNNIILNNSGAQKQSKIRITNHSKF